MTFREWIAGQVERRDSVGDLARDMAADYELSAEMENLDELRAYIDSCGAIDEAIEALECAWGEWYCELVEARP